MRPDGLDPVAVSTAPALWAGGSVIREPKVPDMSERTAALLIIVACLLLVLWVWWQMHWKGGRDE
jgi:hypothetical protein